MSALRQRRVEDLRKIRDLARRSGDRIAITRVDGDPIQRIALLIRANTVGSPAYPRVRADRIGVVIELPARFPFEPPGARVVTPILHPNIWSHGQICLGSVWIKTHGLDLLVRRIVAIVTFDRDGVNPHSVANGAAMAWYQAALARHPGAFPTDRLTEQLQ
jgi:hypothetical protein